MTLSWYGSNSIALLKTSEFGFLVGGSGDGIVESADPTQIVGKKKVVSVAKFYLECSNILPNMHLLDWDLQMLSGQKDVGCRLVEQKNSNMSQNRHRRQTSFLRNPAQGENRSSSKERKHR